MLKTEIRLSSTQFSVKNMFLTEGPCVAGSTEHPTWAKNRQEVSGMVMKTYTSEKNQAAWWLGLPTRPHKGPKAILEGIWKLVRIDTSWCNFHLLLKHSTTWRLRTKLPKSTGRIIPTESSKVSANSNPAKKKITSLLVTWQTHTQQSVLELSVLVLWLPVKRLIARSTSTFIM